ncbi:hypothetical protein P3L10_027389 [Capsicum annuum]
MASIAAIKSTAKATATTSEKKNPVFVKVETLKPGTHGHNLTVKVVESNPVKATGGGGGRGESFAAFMQRIKSDRTIQPVPPFVSIAEMMKKFQSNIREMSVPPMSNSTSNNKTIPRNTTPNPFRLSTEERGAEKERKLFTKLLHKQIEEEKSRIRKANPYPYTTDYPVIPPKPEPKKCTKPEPFQLESLVKHEQETWRHMEERRRMEEEEAKMRNFKAQPVLTEDPIPVPEKVRKPLTEVQDFKLRVDIRSVDRAEFDKKIKQKEMMHKRYRVETESARMIEEEKALKQLRRTLVPHARPVPKFDHPFLPQKSSKQVTKPRSPKLQIDKRKERKATTACPYAAVSTAASQMR